MAVTLHVHTPTHHEVIRYRIVRHVHRFGVWVSYLGLSIQSWACGHDPLRSHSHPINTPAKRSAWAEIARGG